jgi:hypothetical protein
METQGPIIRRVPRPGLGAGFVVAVVAGAGADWVALPWADGPGTLAVGGLFATVLVLAYALMRGRLDRDAVLLAILAVLASAGLFVAIGGAVYYLSPDQT